MIANRRSAWLGAAVAAVAVSAVALAGIVRQNVHGRLSPEDDSSRAKGAFRLVRTDRDNGNASERIEVSCKKLDATRDDSGNLPDYHLVLTSDDGGTSADFGSLTLTRRGTAGFRWNDARNSYPDGIETITEFSEGTIAVVLGDTTVLSGDIPQFRGPGDEAGSGARGVRRDSNRLTATTAGGNAHGAIEARYANTARGSNEQFRVRVEGLSKNGKPYTAYVLDGDGGETSLGDMNPRGRFGVAKLDYDTRRGDEIPGGGSVTDLANLDVEVRDKDGNVVLTGTFPDVVID